MSQENVEIVRMAYEGTNRRNFSNLPSIIDESCELRLPAEFPGTQTARGPEGFRRVLAELEEAFGEIKYEPQELIDEGDLVLATVRTTGHARHTGLLVDLLVFWLYTFRDGTIVGMDVYLDCVKALEAAGLQENR
ncbi:MAG: nuclear transport factor 2 family protein [Actinomycetota bacterium]